MAILSALSCRFNPVDDQTPADAPIDDNTNAYTEALQKVYLKFPSIACVACLYAESLMNFSPWKLWCLESGVAQPHAQKARQVLDKAIQRAPHHPGLNHFLVHLMEMSPFPQAALPSCDVLRFHFPDAGVAIFSSFWCAAFANLVIFLSQVTLSICLPIFTSFLGCMTKLLLAMWKQLLLMKNMY